MSTTAFQWEDPLLLDRQLNEDERMVRDAAAAYCQEKLMPRVLEAFRHEKTDISIFKEMGALGMLGPTIPTQYGGAGLSYVSYGLIAREVERVDSGYRSMMSVQSSLVMVPIYEFGTEAQRQKYVPKLATGIFKGSYGLTEPNSGSDALSAKTTAKLSADGKHYILNGQKCWITNGGFADIYTVFAKIDGEQFTAFIIERGTEGFTQGPEEHKMGIKGSSTVQLYFQDCKVPVENVLGEIGKGHIIAFNILNIGRLKLGAATLGGARRAITTSVQYAKTREQFKLPIVKFGAIRHKLAEMAIRMWVGETALYRVSKNIDEKEQELLAEGKSVSTSLLGAAEEYAIECAILKVFGSEVLDYVVDEGVQIHGGNGYSDEYMISKAYRDSRINRIYEGTNEINRLLTVDMVLKRAMKGKLDLMGPALTVQQELMSIPDFGSSDEGLYAPEKKAIANFKKCILMVAGAAVQKLMMTLNKEQEILMNIADMSIITFHAESALLRLEQLTTTKGEAAVSVQADIVRTYIYDAADAIHKAGKDALNSFADGDELRMMNIGLKRFTKVESFNSKEARRRICARLVADDGYKL
jgi:alkylation response protein AidB-like acyl-CoA dehydrogenase